MTHIDIASPADSPLARRIENFLPGPARNLLASLRRVRDDASAVSQGRYEKLRGIRRQIEDAESALRARAAFFRNATVFDSDPESKRLRDEIAERRIAAARHDHERAAVAEQAGQIGALVKNVEDWLHVSVEEPAAPFDSHGDVSVFETITEARRAIDELKADLHTVRSAPPTRAEVSARLKELVDALAERGRPDLDQVMFHRLPIIRFAETQMHDASLNALLTRDLSRSADGPVLDVPALLCWLNRKEFLKRLEAEADLLAGPEDETLTAVDKRKKERELLSKLLLTERAEVALVEADGRELHRADADPRALLSLSADLPQPEWLRP